MKKYIFTKIEHFLLDRYIKTSLSEENILYIFDSENIDEKDHASLLEAIEDIKHPRHNEVCTLLVKSSIFNESWVNEPEDFISNVSGDYDTELYLDYIEDDDIPDFDSLLDIEEEPAKITLH